MKFSDMFCDPAGGMSEAKFWANGYKAAGMWLGLTHADKLLGDWMLLGVWLLAGIAPDVVKKIIVTRAGGQEKKE